MISATDRCFGNGSSRSKHPLIAGSVKRWNMHRGPMSHGSKSHRQHGSIGASASPSRVFPGLKMAGQLGNERVKVRKLKVFCFPRSAAEASLECKAAWMISLDAFLAMAVHKHIVELLQVLMIDPELNAIVVKGAIPGKAGNLVEVTPAKVVGKNC